VHQISELNHASAHDVGDWIRLVQSEYSEMPGLHLSKCQAQRLWSLDPETCDVVFKTLETLHFLRRMPNDSYVRADAGY
jgi:hypothetical protein